MLNRRETVSEECANCIASRIENQGSVTVGRRQFISATVMAAAAAALAACGGASSSVTAPGTVGLSLKVSDYATLANVGGVALINANGSPIAVVRTGATTFVALSRVCPHQGTTVNLTTNGFLCPNHGASFTLTGTWTGGERTSSMRSYTTSYDAATATISIG